MTTEQYTPDKNMMNLYNLWALAESFNREGDSDIAMQLKLIYSELWPVCEPEEMNWLNEQIINDGL